jgi:hypothetical protein
MFRSNESKRRNKAYPGFSNFIKKGSYFLFLSLLLYFGIWFSNKKYKEFEYYRSSIFNFLKIPTSILKSGFMPFSLINPEKTEMEVLMAKSEILALKSENLKQEEVFKNLGTLRNEISFLKLTGMKIVFVKPDYYSSNGFLSEVIFAFPFKEHKNNFPEIKHNDAVISSKGLYGRISKMTNGSISIISIFNFLSRVPVYTKTSKVYGVASGNGSDILFVHQSFEKNIIEGEEVFTSGENNLIISEIPVGTIKKEGKDIIIIPFSESRPPILSVILNH